MRYTMEVQPTAGQFSHLIDCEAVIFLDFINTF